MTRLGFLFARRHQLSTRQSFGVGLFVLVVIGTTGRAQSPPMDASLANPAAPTQEEIERRVRVDEQLNRPLDLNLVFRDDSGREVRLGEYFSKDKPVLLLLNYSTCPRQCSQQLTALTKVLSEVEWTTGQEFELVRVSIDPKETVEQARQAKSGYTDMYSRPGSEGGWHFLVGSEENIARLANDVGYRYMWVESQRQYVHPTVFILATPDGKISRYINGLDFTPQTLRLSLVEASEGRFGSTADKAILLCFAFDPAQGGYVMAAITAMKVAGAVMVALIVLLMGVMWRLERRRTRRARIDGMAVATPIAR